MRLAQIAQQAFSVCGEGDTDLALVARDRRTHEEATVGGAIDQLHCGVVADLEGVGKFPDSERFRTGVGAQDDEQLVLLRRDSGGTCARFAEGQELAQTGPKSGQCLVILVGHRFGGSAV